MGSHRAPPTSLGAILLAACAVLILQIASTRILSAAVSHHSAFAVIALVMLGLATSATAVFVQRNRRTGAARLPAATDAFLGGGVACAAATAVLVGLSRVDLGGAYPLLAVVAGVLFFGVFWFAGYGIAFLLAEHAEDTGRVYWFDLTGAALGCLLVVPLLDAMSALVVVTWCGALLAAAGVLLALDRADGRRGRALGVFGVLLGLAAAATAFPGLTRLGYAKGLDQSDVLFEQWNRLARVTVSPELPGFERNVALLQAHQPEVDARAVVERWRIGWGMSPTFTGEVPDIRWIMLDTDAGTQIVHQGATRWRDGLEYLEHDVTAVAYHLRRDHLERVFVIGGGGGRDPLTALRFGADHVDVAELNPLVVHAVDEVFGDFSGRPYSLPEVSVTVGDARHALASRDTRYDLVQMSMIDTWASSVAGALVLSENALYTQEAFELYYDHLTDDGLLTVSRWAGQDLWGELARTVALLGGTLRARGVTDPGAHVAVVQTGEHGGPGVATCILKRTPFTADERARLAEVAARLGFELSWNGVPAPGPLDLRGVLEQDPAVLASLPYDLSPAVDDRPFFFNTRPMFLSWWYALRDRDLSIGSRSTVMTGALLVVLVLVGRVLAIAPLQRYDAELPQERRTRLRDHLAPVGYFAGIGVGFMGIELGILQRYLTFLGHPTYAMTVVLFSLLLASGVGANLSTRLRDPAAVRVPLAAIVGMAVATAFLVPPLTDALQSAALAVRIAVAAALVAPLGVAMGTIWPLGVRLLLRDGLEPLVPWVWSINGLAGVIASVLGIMVAMSLGYTAVILLGALAYLATAVAASRSWRVT